MTGTQLKTLGGVTLGCLILAGCSIDERQPDVAPADGAPANPPGADTPAAGAGNGDRLGGMGSADPGAESAVPGNLPVMAGQGAGSPVSPMPSAVDAAPLPTAAAAAAKAAAENVLVANCASCHGAQLTPQQVLGGLNSIGDIDQLVALGLITPLNSAASPVIRRMQRGEMPPPSSGLPAVTVADINIVAQYIDNPEFWPGFQDPCTPASVVNFDELFQLINQDLTGVAAGDAVYSRYVSLTNRASACGTGPSLDPDRQALTKLLNMLSTSDTIFQPVAIDTDATVYRIDLRALAWNRPINVQGQNFNDVWEAIAAKDPYAVHWIGDDADDAVASTQTGFPLLFADQMLSVATLGNLYYGIIGIDVSESLPSFILNQLGVDLAQNLVDATSVRAGTSRSKVSSDDVVVQRDAIETRSGVLWQNLAPPTDPNLSMFEDPFLLSGQAETAAIFTLPNGMLAFVLADQNGVIVEDSELSFNTNPNSFRAATSVSCLNCHSAGFLPVVDEVRVFDLQNFGPGAPGGVSGVLSAADLQRVEEIYVSPEEFARLVQSDSENFYLRALALANLPTQGADPVSSVYLRFDLPVTLGAAASDLAVTPDRLRLSLDLLDPALAVLRNGTMDRDDFSQLFVETLCSMSSLLENQPDGATCAAAER
ncbi:MAG TPA: hypothetical protein VJU61_01805 [Polyangiaceae bacterium]|nr:hypothetical protein [Polyangiaceae bacterium]